MGGAPGDILRPEGPVRKAGMHVEIGSHRIDSIAVLPQPQKAGGTGCGGARPAAPLCYTVFMNDEAGVFHLTDPILERVIFAMEDQSRSRLVDLRTGDLAPLLEGGELPSHLARPPAWTPAEGFALMESWCAGLSNLELRHRLSPVLARGRGVFKAFRKILEEYPKEEARFLNYKLRILRPKVEAWLDDNREALGLARLGPEPEEFSDLVAEEFPVQRISLENAPFPLAEILDRACDETRLRLPSALVSYECDQVESFFRDEGATATLHFIRLDPPGDEEETTPPIALAIQSVLGTGGSALCLVRFIYVDREYEELGLDGRLLEDVARLCREQKVERCLIDSLFAPTEEWKQLPERRFLPLD